LKQALQSFRLIHYGPNVPVPRTVLIGDLVRHLGQFLAEWQRLGKRARHHETGGADLILVQFDVP
jgi:hypothetical protein